MKTDNGILRQNWDKFNSIELCIFALVFVAHVVVVLQMRNADRAYMLFV